MTPATSSADARVAREQAWHDQRFTSESEQRRALGRKTGRMTRDALRVVYDAAKARCRGARVLDYGCSMGEASILLRQHGAASVEGIDISPVAVAQAARRAEAAGVDGVTFQVMDAERLDFPDASFNLVFGIGILHHLDLHRALPELARVLAPDGAAVFLEPLGHNPAIEWMRRRTPHARTEDEHPLVVDDVRLAHQHFGRVHETYVNLATLGAAALAGVPGAALIHRAGRAVDRGLFAIPALRKHAWNVVLTMGHA